MAIVIKRVKDMANTEEYIPSVPLESSLHKSVSQQQKTISVISSICIIIFISTHPFPFCSQKSAATRNVNINYLYTKFRLISNYGNYGIR